MVAVPNPVILSPWVPAQSSYTIAVQDGTTIEILTMNVTAGREYWVIADGHKDCVDASGVGRGDLCRLLKDCIETHSTIAEGEISISISSTTGKLTISTTGSNFCIFWDVPGTTIDGRIFGFYDKSLSNAASHTSDHAVFGWWKPDRPATVDTRRALAPVRSVVEPVAGPPRVAYWGNQRPRRKYEIRLVPPEYILREYATNYEHETLEWFYENSMGKGYPFRIYDDATDIDNGAPVYVLANASIPYSQNGQHPYRWDVSLDCIEVTPYQNTCGVSYMYNSGDPPSNITLSRYWMGSITKFSAFTRVYFSSAHATGGTSEVIWLHASSLTTMAHGLLRHFDGVSFVVQWHEGGGGGGVGTTGVSIAASTHYDVLVVYDGTQSANADRLRVYVNGVDRTGTHSGTIPTSTTATPAAATDGFQFFTDFGGAYADCDDCHVSDFAMWHELALSPAAASEMHNGGMAIDLSLLMNAPPPARWWRFNNNLTPQVRTSNSTITSSGAAYAAVYPGHR